MSDTGAKETEAAPSNDTADVSNGPNGTQKNDSPARPLPMLVEPSDAAKMPPPRRIPAASRDLMAARGDRAGQSAVREDKSQQRPSRPGSSSADLDSAKETLAADIERSMESISPRHKVFLEPGHSPLDWAALRSSGKNLRGVDTPGPVKVTMAELQKHKSRDDAWTAIQGKVYNLTPYLNFHPGGVEMLMWVAGRDGTKMFQQIHRWVNYEYLLEPCWVGFLVPG